MKSWKKSHQIYDSFTLTALDDLHYLWLSNIIDAISFTKRAISFLLLSILKLMPDFNYDNKCEFLFVLKANNIMTFVNVNGVIITCNILSIDISNVGGSTKKRLSMEDRMNFHFTFYNLILHFFNKIHIIICWASN